MDKILQNLNLNETGAWFPIFVGTIALIYMLFMPKRLSWREIYFIYGVGAFVSVTMDVVIMGSQLDIFDLGDPNVEGLADLMAYGVAAPCFAVIFLNYLSQGFKWLLVALFTALSVLSEWIMVQVNYMDLKGWNTFGQYPFILLFMVFGFLGN